MATYPIHGMLLKETRAGAPSVDTHSIGDPANGNTAIGDTALQSLTNNSVSGGVIAIGAEAYQSLTGGFQNVAIGVSAEKKAISVNNNVAVGAAALTQHVSGDHNVAVGSLSMAQATNSIDNTALGYNTLFASTTALQNTALGSKALQGVTTGNNNVGVGFSTGITITTGTGNVVIGQGAAVSAAAAVDQIVIGRAVTGVGNSTCTLGAGANKVSIALDGTTTSWTAASDARLKTDVEDYQVGLSFIEALRPITYDWREKTGKRYSGFLAQEVKAAIDAHDMPTGQHLWDERDGVQMVAAGELIPILVNAVKELAAEVAMLKGRHL